MKKVAVAEKPDQFPRRCVLHVRRTQADRIAEALRVRAVTLRAMLNVELLAREKRIRIAFVWIFPSTRFYRCLRDLAQHSAVVRILVLRVASRTDSDGGERSC